MRRRGAAPEGRRRRTKPPRMHADTAEWAAEAEAATAAVEGGRLPRCCTYEQGGPGCEGHLGKVGDAMVGIAALRLGLTGLELGFGLGFEVRVGVGVGVGGRVGVRVGVRVGRC